jgi:iron(III) transport system ATP-binding protein
VLHDVALDAGRDPRLGNSHGTDAGRLRLVRRLTQIGPPRQIYEAPLDLATAAFVGEAVTLAGVLAGSVAECSLGSVPVQPATPGTLDGTGTVLLRPEQIELTDPAASGAGQVASGTVEGIDYYGHDTMVTIRLDEPRASMISLRHTGTAAPTSRVRLRVRGAGRWYPDGD